MRICCITKDIFAGGAGKSLFVLASEIAKNHDVLVVSKNRQNGPLLQKHNIEHSHVHSGFYPFHYLSGARKPLLLNYLAWMARSVTLFSTLKKVRVFKPDIVILNGFQSLWYAPFLHKGSKVVLYARELLNWERVDAKLAKKVINEYVDCVIAITENEASQLDAVTPSVHVVYNSFEGVFAKSLNDGANTNSEIRVGVFGTLHRIKGQYLVIDMVEKYLDRIKDLHIKFYLYGGASNITTRDGGREQLIKAVKAKQLQDYIQFPGWLQDTNNELQKTDIVLRTDTSGCPWGRDVIEAMSNAKPMVAAGSSEIFIKHGRTGLLYPPGDISKMADNLFLLAGDSEQRRKIGRAAYDFAKQHFSATKNARAVMEILTDVVSGYGSCSAMK